MNKYLVAKSYQDLPQVGEEYTINGKTYIKVRMRNGDLKQVRTYTIEQYHRYNPEVKIIQPAKSQRDALGFGEAGFIWLFKGETYENLNWFRESPCKYNKIWGWYLNSNIEMPDPLPMDIHPIKLEWDEINLDGQLIEENQIKEIVNRLLYDPSPSVFVGKVGDRIEFDGICSKMSIQQNMYGLSYFYVFQSDDKNIFTWGTNSKVLEEGQHYHVRGTVKGHNTYRNIYQTILTRCKIEEI